MSSQAWVALGLEPEHGMTWVTLAALLGGIGFDRHRTGDIRPGKV